MLALNRTTIDFFSLDVEGAELQILQTIDFNKINIRTLTVEFNKIDQGKDLLKTLLTRHGFKHYKTVIHRRPYANDLFFINNDMQR